MMGITQVDPLKVHCRTGSLEIITQTTEAEHVVHCRTGSLEITHMGNS